MGWEDRPYYRDREPSSGNPFLWLLTGSVPLFTVFGIRVRAHASLLVLAGYVLIIGLGAGTGAAARVQFVTVLFGVILLHEFGHCFAARWTGGEAQDILMTPLGGLAMASSRRRPWPTFVTVAGGPLVNVAICLLCGLIVWQGRGVLPLGPWQFGKAYPARDGFAELYAWAYFTYAISYALLLFNLLPVFPLDGGQLLQAALWRPLGYFKSMLATMNVGLAGSVLMVMVGLATFSVGGVGLLLIFIGASCFINCLQMRRMLVAEGPWAFSDEDSPDYGASLYGGATGGYGTPKPSGKKGGGKAGGKSGGGSYKPAYKTDDGEDDEDRRPGWRERLAERRAEKERAADAAERRDVDRVLAKVSASGLASLTRAERKTLARATAHSRRRAVGKR